jgi:hypothetical protein
MKKIDEVEKDIAEVLNKHGLDSLTQTPDFILASYIVTCIAALKSAKVAEASHKILINREG